MKPLGTANEKMMTARCGLFGALALLLLFTAEAASAREDDLSNSPEALAVANAGMIEEPRAAGIPGASPEPPPDQNGWQFAITPYVWLSGLEGEVGVFPQLPPVDVDLSFSDVFDNLKFAGMIAFEARKDRFVAIADVVYVDVGASEDVGIRDPSFSNVDLDTTSFTSTFAAGYRLVDKQDASLDVLAGVRISAVDTQLELSGPNRTIRGDSSETWIDPVIAFRLGVPIGGDWHFAGYVDVGGFGMASDSTWQLMGSVRYELSDRWTLAAGWRHYEVDYRKDDGFIYDVGMTGPIVGATIRF